MCEYTNIYMHVNVCVCVYIYIYIYIGVRQNIRIILKFQTFILIWFSVCNPPIKSVFLLSFLTICVRVRWSLSDSFRFLPKFCFSEEGFFIYFLNSDITFETVLLTTPNNKRFFVTLVPAV